MENENERLLRLTSAMPMKQINLDCVKVSALAGGPPLPEGAINELWLGETTAYKLPYLQRYYAGRFRCGADLWLHRFLSSDGDRHLHSHPFDFWTTPLNGGYKEEFLNKAGAKEIGLLIARGHINKTIEDFLFDLQLGELYAPFAFNFLDASKHYNERTVFDWHRIAEVMPETWTAVVVRSPRLPKWFFKDDDGNLVDMKASNREWYKDYLPRPECGIAQDDNKRK